MQLGWVNVIGLGRLANASMKVRGKVTAVVGPNEAGKSTLLRGLASVSDGEPFEGGPGSDIPRRGAFDPSDTAITLQYVLDAEDQQALASIPSEVRPERLLVSKEYGGAVSYKLDPVGRRPRAPRQAAAEELANLVTRLRSVDDDAPESAYVRENEVVAKAEQAIAVLTDESDPGTLSDDDVAKIVELTDNLAEVAGLSGDIERLPHVLNAMIEAEKATHPTPLMRGELLRRVPVIALFSEADRDLKYEYDLDGLADSSVPPALANLANSARLDLGALLADLERGTWDAVAEHIGDANDALASLFSEAWTAGSGTAEVYLALDGTTLRIMVTSKVGRYSPISERSDGLRMFVALTTFVQAKTGGDRSVILLIDEAENHLHYDAQADLMAVLSRQELAHQVIYTTHSAGCLPDEIGGNIVAVVPDPKSGYSSIDSSYWTGGLGFAPLMMAMGAGAAAITPSRYAILAEGHSEALILPRLIREATGLARLGYQIAAGVAEAGREDIPSLDAEAARVAYLVDGDPGGARNAKKLLQAQIPPERIIHLGGEGSGLCLEDLIKREIYEACEVSARDSLKRDPSKVDVAARLIDVDDTLVDPERGELLAELHSLLSNSLQIPLDQRPTLTSR